MAIKVTGEATRIIEVKPGVSKEVDYTLTEGIEDFKGNPGVKGLKDSFGGTLYADNNTGNVFYYNAEDEEVEIRIKTRMMKDFTVESIEYSPMDGTTVTIPLFELMYLIYGEGELTDRLKFCYDNLYEEVDGELEPTDNLIMPEYYEGLSESGLTIVRNYNVEKPILIKTNTNKNAYRYNQIGNREDLTAQANENFKTLSEVFDEKDVERLKYPLRITFREFEVYFDKTKVSSNEMMFYNLPPKNVEIPFENTKFVPNRFMDDYLKKYSNPLQYKKGKDAKSLSNYFLRIMYDYELEVFDKSKILEETDESGNRVVKVLPEKDIDGKALAFSTKKTDRSQSVQFNVTRFNLKELEAGEKPVIDDEYKKLEAYDENVDELEEDSTEKIDGIYEEVSEESPASKKFTVDDFLKQSIKEFVKRNWGFPDLIEEVIDVRVAAHGYSSTKKSEESLNLDREFNKELEAAVKSKNQSEIDRLEKLNPAAFKYHMEKLSTDQTPYTGSIRIEEEKSQQRKVADLGAQLIDLLKTGTYDEWMYVYNQMKSTSIPFTKQFLNGKNITEKDITTRPSIKREDLMPL